MNELPNQLLTDIEDAMRANNMRHDSAFRQDLCQCDPSVGMCPCPYCTIHTTLKRCKTFIQDKAPKLGKPVVLLDGIVQLEEQEVARPLGCNCLIHNPQKQRVGWVKRSNGISNVGKILDLLWHLNGKWVKVTIEAEESVYQDKEGGR